MSAKKILMIVGDYVEDYEVMVPLRRILMVGHTVHAICPGRRMERRFGQLYTILRETRLTAKNPGTIFR